MFEYLPLFPKLNASNDHKNHEPLCQIHPIDQLQAGHNLRHINLYLDSTQKLLENYLRSDI